MKNVIEFERAFAGSTVHDIFAFATAAVLLPLEVLVGLFVPDGGGLIFWYSRGCRSCSVDVTLVLLSGALTH
jgi:hypothetical protein